jgi:hypothetical protein
MPARTGDVTAPADVVTSSDELLSRTMLLTGPPEDAIAVVRRAQRDLPIEFADNRRALAAVELFAANFGGADVDTRQRLLDALASVDGDGPGARMIRAVLAWDLAVAGGAAASGAREPRTR